MWAHADAAYGGLFRMVDRGAELLPDLDQCHSITLDPHKTLFLPYGTGCLLVRDAEALRAAPASEAEYLRDVAAEGDPINFTDLPPELSRDFRGLRVWLPIALHGARAFRTALEEKLRLARLAHDELAADGRFEMIDEPQLSVVAFRLRGKGDAANKELLAR